MARLPRWDPLWDRFTALDDALSSVGAALEALQHGDDLDDDILDALDEVEVLLTHRRKEAHDDIEAHDNAERERERAGAWVGVI